jgi:fluoroquinolone transport system permease protein
MAPIFALTLATFASNKVVELTLMKGLGILMLGPLAAYFVNPAWQPLFGILPTYWSARTLWAAGEGGTESSFVLSGHTYCVVALSLLRRVGGHIETLVNQRVHLARRAELTRAGEIV